MPAPAKSDRRFLEQHGTKWRVVVNVPRDLQKAVGKTKLKQPLDTDSLAEANRLKWPWVAKFQHQIDQYRNPQGLPQDLDKEAMRLASMKQAIRTEAEDAAFLEYVHQRVEDIAGDPVAPEVPGEPPVYAQEREQAVLRFVGLATGKRTPIDAQRERYEKQLNVKPRTMADDKRAIRYLLDWCKANDVPPYVETFKKRDAVAFFDDFPDILGTKQPRTLNKYIRRLGSYWKWMGNRDDGIVNVWQERSYAVPHETTNDKERPFTDDEVKRLLAGDAPQEMHDLMRIGALSGARLDAIVCLAVKDCANNTFVFKPQKKEPGPRLCPIHPDLYQIIERRTVGKQPDDPLFPEWPPVKKAGSLRERSFKASPQFTEYRRSVGIDERREGNRRSRVNFHSFRRWFITSAERADQPESIIASVVGHTRNGMTLGVYSAGPKLEQARRCVEAVKLPKINRSGQG